jgi:hypothetical protein
MRVHQHDYFDESILQQVELTHIWCDGWSEESGSRVARIPHPSQKMRGIAHPAHLHGTKTDLSG